MRLLFVMASPEYLRFYDSTIQELAARGHHVLLAVNSSREKKPVGLEGLHALGPEVEVLGVAPSHDGAWGEIGHGLRGLMDFVRYLDPRLANARVLRARMKRKAAPAAFRWLDGVSSLPPAVVRALLRVLAGFERAVPPSRAIVEFVERARADVLLVSPLVDAASDQVDWIKAAQTLGIRTAAGIASWDNLTNKGLLRVIPDRVIVWNEAQRHEAVAYHGAPADRVAVTGAQLFDRWFVKQVTRDREAFCARVGLPDAQPFILFTGSSSFISESNAEVAFVRRWIAALRSSPDRWIRDLHVLVRPPPHNCHAWQHDTLSDFPGVTVYPGAGYNPVDEENRADFFDSLAHSAAVVGINTSAMIEAAIVGRPVFSMLTGDFAGTQEGTIHFHHLLPENGGCVRIASTLDEHVAQLGDRLKDPEAAHAETQRFVASFIRPHGIDRPATPIVVDALEAVAALGPATAAAPPAWAPLIRPFLFAGATAAAAVAQLRGPVPFKGARKRLRHATHRLRKNTARTYSTSVDGVRRSFRLIVKRSRKRVRTAATLAARHAASGGRKES